MWWLWLKTKVAEIMVWLGIDWPGISDGDKLNSVIGIGIGVIGIFLGILSYKITRRQGEIAESQHKLQTDLLNRKAKLTLVLSPVGTPLGDPGMMRHPVYMINSGNKSANDVLWQIWIPQEHMRNDRVQIKFPDSKPYPERIGIEGINAGPFYRRDGIRRLPINPRRSQEIGYFLIHQDWFDRIQFYWQIDAEDGLFPEHRPEIMRLQGED